MSDAGPDEGATEDLVVATTFQSVLLLCMQIANKSSWIFPFSPFGAALMMEKVLREAGSETAC